MAGTCLTLYFTVCVHYEQSLFLMQVLTLSGAQQLATICDGTDPDCALKISSWVMSCLLPTVISPFQNLSAALLSWNAQGPTELSPSRERDICLGWLGWCADTITFIRFGSHAAMAAMARKIIVYGVPKQPSSTMASAISSFKRKCDGDAADDVNNDFEPLERGTDSVVLGTYRLC